MSPEERATLLQAIEEELWDMICSGGGNDETVKMYAEQIMTLFDK